MYVFANRLLGTSQSFVEFYLEYTNQICVLNEVFWINAWVMVTQMRSIFEKKHNLELSVFVSANHQFHHMNQTR